MPEPSDQVGILDRITAARRTWPAEPRHLTEVRSITRHWLAAIGLHGETQEDLVLAVNEAASNVIDHAYREKTADDVLLLALWVEPGTLSIEIIDRGTWRPVPAHPRTRGKGLAMMYRLVDSVLIHRGPDGTRVLLRHPRPA